jgi:hypothetical protein
MDRTEFLRQYVLSEISDDYENIDQIIFPAVAKIGNDHGFSIERSDIVNALKALVADGLADAYILSSHEPFSVRLDGMPTLDAPEVNFKTYFLITKKGLNCLVDRSTNI